MYQAAAIAVLILHVAFILWVIFGALLTRGRRLLAGLHLASLLWSLLVQTLPWTCPLTLVENWLEARAGAMPYADGFLLHYLDALVYPNLPPLLLTVAAAIVVSVNVAIYGRRWLRR